jgi:hypothetical protein
VLSFGGGNVKPWKQTILTMLTIQVELTTLDIASIEVEWLCKLLIELPVVEKPILVVSM